MASASNNSVKRLGVTKATDKKDTQKARLAKLSQVNTTG
jgi:hypothetical protein